MKTRTFDNGESSNQNPRMKSAVPKTFHGSFSVVVGLLVLAMFVPLARAVPAQLISARSSAVPLPAGGNDNSVAPSLSPDGRFVVFSSTANDLVPGGKNFYSENVLLRDRASNSTVLVSRSLNNTGGGNGPSLLGQASTNGQFVVFQSDASDLVPNDTNGFTDIFVRDVVAGTTTLVSVSANGGPANGPSTYPVITPDGRYVAFISGASNLVAGDTNGILDVFVRDLVGGTSVLVSVGATASGSVNPVMATPVITPDGQYAAFFSSAAALVSSVPAGSPGEVYLWNRTALKPAPKVIWASTNAGAMVSAALGLSGVPAYHPQLSDDGRYVAFKAGSLSPTGAVMILRYDAVAATTTAVSTNDLGWYIGPDDNGGPEMTPDGRFIAFARHEGALSLGASSIHVWDSQGAVDTSVSDNGSGVVTNVFSQSPAISPDGQFVAFVSNATNLTGNAISNGFHVYLRNLTSSTTQLADADTNGVGSTDDTLASLSLSADGRFVAFDSPDGRLVGGDNNRAEDVFVRDLVGGTTELISPRDATVIPQAANKFSLMSPLSVSADGRWAAFASAADDLVPNDTNKLADIFVRDLVNGTDVLASVGFDGSSALGGNSGSAVISADGRYVVFVSSASNLVAGVTLITNNVFRRDLQAGTTALVSLGSNGISPGNSDSSDPVISTNGRYVAFLSLANNLAPGATIGMNTYWRDMNLTQVVGLTNGNPSAVSVFRPSMSRDGRYVAFGYYSNSISALGIKIQDTQLGLNIYTNTANTTAISLVAIDPSGAKIFYQKTTFPGLTGAYDLHVDNIATRSNLFSITSQASPWGAASWSDDGRWLTFVSTTNLSGGDDGVSKVYLKDFQTGTLSLIGLAGPGTNGGAASSDGPVISGDGRFVAYRSVVTNTVIGDTTAPPNLFLLDRLTASNIVLAAGTAMPGQLSWMSRPVISDGGATVVFLNLGSSLTTGDLNRAVDVFGAAVDVNAVPVDSDGDGIPDWWMMQYFGHPTGQAGDLSRASDDADGDGVSNLQEYLAGTNPMDPTWRFQLTIDGPSNDKVRLTWLPVAGRNYQVQYKTNLNDPQWLVPTGSIGVLGNLYYYTAPADQTQIFYRVRESN